MNAPLRIRRRVLLAALLPVTLVAVALSAVFLLGRLGDLDAAHAARVRSLARQLASASEYGLFAGNVDNLHAIAIGALREPEVRAVMIVDRQGEVLAYAGDRQLAHVVPAPSTAPGEAQTRFDAATQMEWLVQPVAANPLPLDDLYANEAAQAAAPVLGSVQLAVSHRSLSAREREILGLGLAVALGGLLLAWLLAMHLSQGVVRPVRHISAMIERIGRGDLTARALEQPDDPLQGLHRGLNQMAQSLQQSREELEERIATATRELRLKKEEAETATLAKSRFLAAASHDLRQPVHALGMFVSSLARLPHGDEARRLVSYLDASVQAMQNLLDALLDISRLDAGVVTPQVTSFALHEILALLRAELEPQALQKGIRLRIPTSEAWVQSDPTLLHRILLNLVGNAVRYTNRGGVLVVCRRACGGSRWRIEVWDTGIGIAPQHQRDVFREFFQVGNEQRDRRQGLGLGLNIVHRTAQLLGHALQLRSEPGRGTRFCIEVPCGTAQPHAPLVVPAQAAPAADELAGRQVLVVEDDALAAAALTELLGAWGCKVRVAAGLSAALEQLSHGFMPDLLISDYRLGRQTNGMEVLYRLRQVCGKPLPAFLVSGDTDAELIQRVRQTEFELLHKPVRPAKLRSLMRHLLLTGRRD